MTWVILEMRSLGSGTPGSGRAGTGRSPTAGTSTAGRDGRPGTSGILTPVAAGRLGIADVGTAGRLGTPVTGTGTAGGLGSPGVGTVGSADAIVDLVISLALVGKPVLRKDLLGTAGTGTPATDNGSGTPGRITAEAATAKAEIKESFDGCIVRVFGLMR